MDPSLRWGDALLVGSEPKRYLPGCHSCNGGLRVPRLTMPAAALSYRPAPAADPHARSVRLPDHPTPARAASRPPSTLFLSEEPSVGEKCLHLCRSRCATDQ